MAADLPPRGAFENLREFIAHLERAGELVRVRERVSPRLEITEIAERVMKSPGGGKALLFENVEGSAMPLAINLLGSRQRMAMTLGTEDPADITEGILALLDPKGASTLWEKIKMLPKLKSLADAKPVEVRSGPCQEVVMAEPAFDPFPILTCWPQDGGPYITLPMISTRDPRTGMTNCGAYRMQIFDSRTAGMHWQIHHGGAEHHRAAEARGERIDVAVAIGCDPVSMFAPVLPLPPDIDEMMFAGLIRQRPVRMVKCKTSDLLVPAESEIVFEGYVDPGERRLEGPFGDHTGFYSLPEMYPVFHLTAVTHRRDPIYCATVVGRPPMEDCWMGEAVVEMFLPVIRKQIPEIVDMHLPFAGVFHNCVIVSIDKQYPGHARKVMHAIWGTGQMSLTKCVIVLDKDANVRDPAEVAWRAFGNVDPSRDLELARGPIDVLDHATDIVGYGGKVGIDATRKWKTEGFPRDWPEDMAMSEEIRRRVDAKWTRLGIS
jgi:4-hydroxy-3-polyprenylbenzoate decarboxylase